jgi:hypothetical protein
MTLKQTVAESIHTFFRLNDPTTFNGGVPAVRVIGAGGSVYRGVPTNPTPSVLDVGYSGDPLSVFTAQPPQSPRPWAYVADSNQYRKFTTDGGTAFDVGLSQPSSPATEPLVSVNMIQTLAHDPQSEATWVAAGSSATNPVAGTRINTTVSQILYDVGVTGNCSIVPADQRNITVGTRVGVGTDSAIVMEITIPVADTTVEAIIYDAGTTGPCTIYPSGSLGVGQLDAPGVAVYQRRSFQQQSTAYSVPKNAGDIPLPRYPNQPVYRTRQVDFPVNCVIELDGEAVRIQSVAVGADGTQSFRCTTSHTVSAGGAIVGLPAFRCNLPTTQAPGAAITRGDLENTITYPAPATGERADVTGGIQAGFLLNCAQFTSGTSVLPEDDIHVAINIDRLQEVVSVRIYLDVDASHDPATNYTQNVFFYEWRASDLITAVQTINAQNVASIIDARKTVVTNQQLEGTTTPSAQTGTTAPSNQEQPVATSAVATQLALGNNQWVDLKVKVRDLIRVGTDPSQTLQDVGAIQILIHATGPSPDVTPEPLNIKYSDIQFYGGGSPDVGDVGDPYVYTYRYRSTLTGIVSNPAPHSRGGVIARRQSVSLTATPSGDGQVDRIDWFRMGGALSKYTYLGTGPNTVAPFVDNQEDSSIDGGELISYNKFKPWALLDDPAKGLCKVAGTAILRLSGSALNPFWAPGSIVLVNGRATTLYASPVGDLMFVTDNVGASNSVEFMLPGPTFMDRPLGRVWGDYLGIFFACGDNINPGTLYYSNGNNIESMDDGNSIIVTSGSEQLQNGGVYNTFPFVASTENIFAIYVNPNDPIAAVRTVKTPAGRGFWTPWAWCLGSEGIIFLTQDGLALSRGGAPADIFTTPDLRDIFPKDGVPGRTVNGIPGVDMSQTNFLRLSYITGMVYFDYLDFQGNPNTLIFDISGKRFFLDSSFLTGVNVRLEEPGAGIYDQILGGQNGQVLQYDEDAMIDVDVPIGWAVYTRLVDADQPRIIKQFGDIGLNLDPAGSVDGITVIPYITDGTATEPPTVIGTGSSGRRTAILDVPGGSILSQNLGIQISGVLEETDTDRPRLFWWEPNFIPKTDDNQARASDWDDLGYAGAKFVQGIVIRANTYGVAKQVMVERADATGPETMITLTCTHNGESQIAYPLAPEGWSPFIAELVRLRGIGDDPWQLLNYRFVFEPAPELATQWETQFTSTDWPGYGTLRDMMVAYEATTPLILVITFDDRDQTYILPETGGTYLRYYFPLCPNKARAVRFKWTTEEPARLYKRDLTVRAQGWGDRSGYRYLNPFGGPSRADGAAI